jgi:hypothetical protein
VEILKFCNKEMSEEIDTLTRFGHCTVYTYIETLQDILQICTTYEST